MQALQHHFLGLGFSAADVDTICGRFTEKKIPRGEYFVHEGKTSKYLGFITKGFLQYFIVLEGEEKTTYTTGENNFVASLFSFLKQVPAKENIRAVVDSTVWVIEREALTQLQTSIPAFKDFYVALLEWQICCIDESRLDAIMLTAQQRYEKMLEKEPGLIRQIPLQYLASMLGVTARHLSRIRNNIR